MPGPNHKAPEKPKNLGHSAKLFIKSLGKYRLALIIICLLAAIATFLTIFGPKILGNMTTTAVTSLTTTGQIDWVPIASSAITLIILYIISAIISYIQGYILTIVSSKYIAGLRSKILDKISRLPIAY